MSKSGSETKNKENTKPNTNDAPQFQPKSEMPPIDPAKDNGKHPDIEMRPMKEYVDLKSNNQSTDVWHLSYGDIIEFIQGEHSLCEIVTDLQKNEEHVFNPPTAQELTAKINTLTKKKTGKYEIESSKMAKQTAELVVPPKSAEEKKSIVYEQKKQDKFYAGQKVVSFSRGRLKEIGTITGINGLMASVEWGCGLETSELLARLIPIS